MPDGLIDLVYHTSYNTYNLLSVRYLITDSLPANLLQTADSRQLPTLPNLPYKFNGGYLGNRYRTSALLLYR